MKKKGRMRKPISSYEVKCKVLALSELVYRDGAELHIGSEGATYGVSLLLKDVADDIDNLEDCDKT